MANLSNINGKFVVEQTTGYVGVGTTDPNYPIEVLNASAEIALNASGGSIYRVQSDSASNFIIRKEGVGDRLVINSAGNSTFAGTINSDNITVGKTDGNNSSISLTANTGNWTFTNVQASRNLEISDSDGTGTVMTIDTSGNATFAGNVTVGGQDLFFTNGNETASIEAEPEYLHLQSRYNSNLGAQFWLGNGNPSDSALYTSASSHYFRSLDTNTNYLTINSSGNVGINETNPLQKLHVNSGSGNSAAIFESTDLNSQIWLKDSSSSSTYQTGIACSGDNLLFNNGGERMRIDSSGQVLIDIAGTTGADLAAGGVAYRNNSGSYLQLSSGVNTDTNFMYFYRKNAAGTSVESIGSISNSGLGLVLNGSGQSNQLILDSSGNVGIGTVSPVSTWLSGFDPSTGNGTFKLTSEGWIVTPMYTGLAAYYPGQGARPIIWSDDGGTNIQSFDNNITDGVSIRSSNNSVRLFVREDGNVGIGTTGPATQLHVESDNPIITLQRNNNGNASGALQFRGNDNVVDWQIGTNQVVGLGLEFNFQNSNKVYIETGGNVGIGTTSPSKKLEVAGSYKLGTNAYIQYDAGYPYTINMLNTAAVGNLILNAGAGSSGYESKIELQGGNTAGSASITFTTASSQALVIKNGGDLTVTGSLVDQNGVRTYTNGGQMNNNVAYTFDITVPNDSSSGTVHHVTAMMTHYRDVYGCVLDCYAYSRGQTIAPQTNLVNQTSTGGGAWTVTKPNNTTLRITKTAGTYVGAGSYQIVVVTKGP